jgi:hypothetical protein
MSYRIDQKLHTTNGIESSALKDYFQQIDHVALLQET